jgi:hypothetical protein
MGMGIEGARFSSGLGRAKVNADGNHGRDEGPSQDEIAAVVGEIVGRFRPARIVLFGSRAWGAPGADSDVDCWW